MRSGERPESFLLGGSASATVGSTALLISRRFGAHRIPLPSAMVAKLMTAWGYSAACLGSSRAQRLSNSQTSGKPISSFILAKS